METTKESSNDILADRLDKLMKEQKITSKAMSEDLLGTYGYKIGKGSIAKYRNNERKPPPTLIGHFAEILKVPTDYLLGIGEKSVSSSIPILGTASCGEMETQRLRRYDTLPYNEKNFNNYLYCVIADDESMSPEIWKGDKIICDPTVKPVSGDIVHYKLGNKSAIKVLWIDENSDIMQLIPYNYVRTHITTIRGNDKKLDDMIMAKVIDVKTSTIRNKNNRLKFLGRI